MPATTSTSINFYLAASINAENDCLLVPSMDALSTHSKKPLAVHWLNNKELAFNQEVEKILTDALLHDTPDASNKSDLQNKEPSDDVSHQNGHSITPPSPLPPESITTESPSATMKLSSHGSIQDLSSLKFDVKLESLLRQWNKSFDVLFSVHPVDGSLLTWLVAYLLFKSTWF